MSLPLLHQAWSPNYSSRGGQRVRLIVAHDCEGSYSGSVGWFLQSQSQVSAHIVLSEDGTVATQMVGWANKAWHVCAFNPFSEGIEAAGYASKGLAAPEWDALAAIVAFRLHANGIPLQIASAANDWTGYCQHVDLGAAGGGHHDITLDSATRAAFYQRVASAYNDPNAPTTWIGAPLPGIPVAPTGWAPSGTVRHDLAPPSLEWVQMRLNALGYANPPLTVDGLDGPDTQAAVRNFQTAKNLIVDGIAGPLTVAALQ